MYCLLSISLPAYQLSLSQLRQVPVHLLGRQSHFCFLTVSIAVYLLVAFLDDLDMLYVLQLLHSPFLLALIIALSFSTESADA